MSDSSNSETEINFRLDNIESTNQTWQQALTLEKRRYLIKKIVKTLLEVDRQRPALNLKIFINDFIKYSIHIEYEMFSKANDLEDYFHLLAERIYLSQNRLKGK
jgi:hypothetical protein